MNNIAIISKKETFNWILNNCVIPHAPISVSNFRDVVGRGYVGYFIDDHEEIKEIDEIIDYLKIHNVKQIYSLELKNEK